VPAKAPVVHRSPRRREVQNGRHRALDVLARDRDAVVPQPSQVVREQLAPVCTPRRRVEARNQRVDHVVREASAANLPPTTYFVRSMRSAKRQPSAVRT